jgi:hypothetical protein
VGLLLNHNQPPVKLNRSYPTLRPVARKQRRQTNAVKTTPSNHAVKNHAVKPRRQKQRRQKQRRQKQRR